jgi:hypothetical protein
MITPAFAETIISSGSDFGYDIGYGAVSFTTQSAYTDFAATIDLAQVGDIISLPSGQDEQVSSIGDLTAYITTDIGPDATVADVLASTTLSIPLYITGTVDLFSGLTLDPGTYYLVVAAPIDTFIYDTSGADTLGTGVSGVTNYEGSGTPTTAGFEPSDTFTTFEDGKHSNFAVDLTGTPASVPEPMSLELLGFSIASVAAMRRRWS